MFSRELLMPITIFLCCSATMAMSTTTVSPAQSTPKKMIIAVPVADVRTEPKSPAANLKLPTCSADNPLQETQALYGEHIIALEEVDGWIRVQALEQAKNRNGVWQGYPGWIKKDQALPVTTFPQYNLVVTKQWAKLCDEKQSKSVMEVCIGTKLLGLEHDDKTWTVQLLNGTKAIINTTDVYEISNAVKDDEKDMRKQAVANAISFEKSPYSWGDRSAVNKQYPVSSVDCSGLINLTFRAIGIELARDAHDQYLQAATVANGKDIQLGDLVFLARTTKPTRMNHVMMYIGNEKLIEATFSGGIDHTRIVTVTAKLGCPLSELTDGQTRGEYVIHLGSILGSKELLTSLRAQALRTTYNY